MLPVTGVGRLLVTRTSSPRTQADTAVAMWALALAGPALLPALTS